MLRMRRIRQRLAEQACDRRGIAWAREHEIDRRAGGIDGSVEVAPTPLTRTSVSSIRQDLWVGLR